MLTVTHPVPGSPGVRVLREALAKFPDSPKEQLAYFCAKTQKTKSSYYRILGRYREEIDE